MSEELKTIVINDQEYDISMFSENTQKLAKVIMRWSNELSDAQLEVAKIEAAIREAQRELIESVQKQINSSNQTA